MKALRARPFMHFGAGIAVTVAAAWSLSSWQASASVGADESTFVSVSPTRVLDTRTDLGLVGPFVSADPQDLRITGSVPTAVGALTVVPDGATGVILNVTVVSPSAAGFVSIRPADASGPLTTSNLNFEAGDIVPNSVTVQLPTTGNNAGSIEITYDAFGIPGPTTEILIDIVGYTKNAGLASLQAQVNELQAIVNAATAPGAVTTGQIAPDAVTSGQIAPGAVGSSEIAPNAINSTNIVNNSLTVDDLGPNSVGPDELINGTVGLAEMNAVIVEPTAVDAPAIVVAGTCSPDIAVPVAGAPAQNRTLVLVSRPQVATANNDFIASGGGQAAAGFANVVVCNNGAVDANPPALLVSFIVLGP